MEEWGEREWEGEREDGKNYFLVSDEEPVVLT